MSGVRWQDKFLGEGFSQYLDVEKITVQIGDVEKPLSEWMSDFAALTARVEALEGKPTPVVVTGAKWSDGECGETSPAQPDPDVEEDVTFKSEPKKKTSVPVSFKQAQPSPAVTGEGWRVSWMEGQNPYVWRAYRDVRELWVVEKIFVWDLQGELWQPYDPAHPEPPEPPVESEVG